MAVQCLLLLQTTTKEYTSETRWIVTEGEEDPATTFNTINSQNYIF